MTEENEGDGRLRRPVSLPSIGGDSFLGKGEANNVPMDLSFLPSGRTSSTSVVCTTAQIDTSITRTSSMGSSFQRHATAAAAGNNILQQQSSQQPSSKHRHSSYPSTPSHGAAAVTTVSSSASDGLLSSSATTALFSNSAAHRHGGWVPNGAPAAATHRTAIEAAATATSLLSQALNLCQPSVSASCDMVAGGGGAFGLATSPRPRRKSSTKSKAIKKLKYHEYKPPNSKQQQQAQQPSPGAVAPAMSSPTAMATSGAVPVANGNPSPTAQSTNDQQQRLIMQQQALLLQFQLLQAQVANPYRKFILPATPALAEKRRKEGTSPGWVNGRVDYDNVDWQKVSVAELKSELQRRGLPVSGKKAALIERLKQHADHLKQEQHNSQHRQQQQHQQLQQNHLHHQQQLIPESIPSPADSSGSSSMSHCSSVSSAMSPAAMADMSPAATDMSTGTPLPDSNCPTPQPPCDDRPPSASLLDSATASDLDSCSEMSVQDQSGGGGLIRLWCDDSSVGSASSEQLRGAALAGVARPRPRHAASVQHIDALNLLMPQEQHDLMMQLVQTQLADTNNQIVQNQHREFLQQRQKELQQQDRQQQTPSVLDLSPVSSESSSQPQQQQQQQQQSQLQRHQHPPLHQSEQHAGQVQEPQRQREELERGRALNLDFLATQNQQITELQHEPMLRDRSHKRRSRSANQKRHSWVSGLPSKSSHAGHPQRQQSLPTQSRCSATLPNHGRQPQQHSALSPAAAAAVAATTTTTAAAASRPVSSPQVGKASSPLHGGGGGTGGGSGGGHPPLRMSKSYAAGTTLLAENHGMPLSPRAGATTDTSQVSPLAHGAAIPSNIVQRTHSFTSSPKSPPVRRTRAASSSSNAAAGRTSRSMSVPNSPVQSPQHSPHSSQHNLNLIEDRLPKAFAASQPTAIPSSPTHTNMLHTSLPHQSSPRSSSPSAAAGQRSLSSPSGYRSRSKTDSIILGAMAASPLSFHEYPNAAYHPFGSPSSHGLGSPRSAMLGSSPGLSYSSQDLGAAESFASSPGVSSAASLPSLAPWPGTRASSSQPCSPPPRRRRGGAPDGFDGCSSPLGHRSPSSTVRSMSPMTLTAAAAAAGHGVAAAAAAVCNGIVSGGVMEAGLDRSPMSAFMSHHPRSSSFSGCFSGQDGVPMNIEPVVHSSSMDDLFDLINKEDMVSEMVFGDASLPLSHHAASLSGLDMVGNAGNVGGGAGNGASSNGPTAMAGLEDGGGPLHRPHSTSNLYSGDFGSPSALVQSAFSSHPSLPMLGAMTSPLHLAAADDFMDVSGSSLGQSPLLMSEQEHHSAMEGYVGGEENHVSVACDEQEKEQQQHLQKGLTGCFVPVPPSTSGADKLSWLDLSVMGHRMEATGAAASPGSSTLDGGVAAHAVPNMQSSVSLGQLPTNMSHQQRHQLQLQQQQQHHHQLLLQGAPALAGLSFIQPSYAPPSGVRFPWDYPLS